MRLWKGEELLSGWSEENLFTVELIGRICAIFLQALNYLFGKVNGVVRKNRDLIKKEY